MDPSVAMRNRTEQEIKALDREYVLHAWSAHRGLDPLVVTEARGCYFWGPNGTRYLDLYAQMGTINAGHSHPRIIEAIHQQLARATHVSPDFANDARSELARLVAGVVPAGLQKTFFTNGGTEANEHTVKIARMVTGRPKILARYRSYHGGTIATTRVRTV